MRQAYPIQHWRLSVSLVAWLLFFAAALAPFAWALPIASPYPMGFLQPTPPPEPDYDAIPIESNAAIRSWIKYFTKTDRARFARFMERGARYRKLVQEILKDNGVPAELYYLGMIESGYASRARSHARAVGIWQFMPATARQYGLRVDHEVDERLDVLRATTAAAKYLKNLKREFGSWYLAIAAYNCGEGRVRQAVRRAHSRNFWTLARRGALPRETAQYIPKFQAAMHIARDPDRFGFVEQPHFNFPEIRPMRFPASTHLSEISRRSRVPLAALRAMNPQLLHSRTPRHNGSYSVWVPKIKSLE